MESEIEKLVAASKAIAKVMEHNKKLQRALVELDTGGGDYLTSRRDISALSGLPMMGATWDEHIKEIRNKLEKRP